MSNYEESLKKLLEEADIKRAVIIGLDGSVLAKSEGDKAFFIDEEELKTFSAVFTNASTEQNTRVQLEQQNYDAPNSEEDIMYGKRHGSAFFAARSNKVIVIAIICDKHESGPTRAAVQKIARELGNQ